MDVMKRKEKIINKYMGSNKFMNKKALVVLSGGLDSTTLLHWAKANFGRVIAISYDFKQKYIENDDPKKIMFQNNIVELQCAENICKKLHVKHYVIDVSFLNKTLKAMQENEKRFNGTIVKHQPKTCMPFRNMILLSASLGVAELEDIDYILTGYQTQDKHGYWDTTKAFVNNINKVAKLNPTKEIKVLAPFAKLNKDEEILLGEYLHVNYSDTWTCYNPIKQDGKFVSCGNCPACKDRLLNFEKLGLKDPIAYYNIKGKEK